MKYFLDLDFQDNKLTVLEAYVNFLKKTRKRHLKSNCETIIFEKDQYKIVFSGCFSFSLFASCFSRALTLFFSAVS